MAFEDYGVDRAVPLSDGTPVDRIHKRYVIDMASEPRTAS
jgi:hypothetical protein